MITGNTSSKIPESEFRKTQYGQNPCWEQPLEETYLQSTTEDYVRSNRFLKLSNGVYLNLEYIITATPCYEDITKELSLGDIFDIKLQLGLAARGFVASTLMITDLKDMLSVARYIEESNDRTCTAEKSLMYYIAKALDYQVTKEKNEKETI